MKKTIQLFAALTLATGFSTAWAGDPAVAPESAAKGAAEVEGKNAEQTHMKQMHQNMDDMHKSMGDSKAGMGNMQGESKDTGMPQMQEHMKNMHKSMGGSKSGMGNMPADGKNGGMPQMQDQMKDMQQPKSNSKPEKPKKDAATIPADDHSAHHPNQGVADKQ